jgi:methionine-rich copper-binding protein CopC
VKTLAIAVALALMPAGVSAHAFPDHSEPRVGHSVEAPRSVRIWFDGAIEPVFSTVRVEDGDKRRVDAGDARVDPKDNTLVAVSLPTLRPAATRSSGAWWRVTATGRKGRSPFRSSKP